MRSRSSLRSRRRRTASWRPSTRTGAIDCPADGVAIPPALPPIGGWNGLTLACIEHSGNVHQRGRSVSATASAEALARSLFSPAVRADPSPTYARLRAEAPVTEAFDGVWTVAAYDDCHSILREPGWSSDPLTQRDDVDRLAARGRGTPIEPLVRQIMLFRDPPD